MNRTQRRQQRLGRSPTVVALRSNTKPPRRFKPNRFTTACCNRVIIKAGTDNPDEAAKFVCRLMETHFRETGNPPITLDPTAPMLFAHDAITMEMLAFVSLRPLPNGKVYLENFLRIPGRRGTMAARALCQRVMQIPAKKMCMVEAGNPKMLEVLEHYGGHVVGYIVEGPTDLGAPELSAAAVAMEAI